LIASEILSENGDDSVNATPAIVSQFDSHELEEAAEISFKRKTFA